MPKSGQKLEIHGPYEILTALIAYDYGVPPKDIIALYGIPNSTLYRWVHKYRDDVARMKKLLMRISINGIPEGNPELWMG